jgi:hypothetical protein
MTFSRLVVAAERMSGSLKPLNHGLKSGKATEVNIS